jgi:hypothetical protein
MRKFIFRALHRLAQKTDNQIDDLLLEGLEGPSALLIIALALYISIRLSELPETYMPYAIKGMYLSLILTVTMGLANTSGRLLAYFLKKVDLPISVSSLLNAVAKAIVYAVGVLIMLNFVGGKADRAPGRVGGESQAAEASTNQDSHQAPREVMQVPDAHA